MFTIFDFDDTLFPTSYLEKNKIDLNKEGVEIPDKILDKIRIYGKIVETTINLARQSGYVIVITNANEAWVNKCIQKTGICTSLEKIQVFSSKDMGVASEYSFELRKKRMFELIVPSLLIEEKYTQIMCFGDTTADKHASDHLRDMYMERFSIKSITLKATGTIKKMAMQHRAIQNAFWHLKNVVGHFSISIAPFSDVFLTGLNGKIQLGRDQEWDDKSLDDLLEETIHNVSTAIVSQVLELEKL